MINNMAENCAADSVNGICQLGKAMEAERIRAAKNNRPAKRRGPRDLADDHYRGLGMAHNSCSIRAKQIGFYIWPA